MPDSGPEWNRDGVMNGIIWLASYPKSGNTWFRIFLRNLLGEHDRPAHINALDHEHDLHAPDRGPFDLAVGYDSSELTDEEADRLRPEVYRLYAERATKPLVCKIHDAYSVLPDGRPLIPADATRAVLYFVRNPLDVCVSWAHHGGHEDYDRIIRRMANPDYMVGHGSGRDVIQLRQKFSTWSGHVTSWLGAAGLRVHLVRFEDLKLRPEETFTAATRFAGLAHDVARINKAIGFSRFEELKAQEEAGGFIERMTAAKAFFRKGEIGSWRGALTAAQVQKIVDDHGEMMRRLGYLDEKGAVVF
jgi:sulfotransferase family protein